MTPRHAVRSATALPRVSVVMPVRDEAPYIERSLGAVLGQDYPSDLLEVIVADGMSTDGTREMVQALQRAHRNVVLVDNHRRTAPAGLNVAISAASGDVIARVDGHCEIAPDYLRRCVAHLGEGVDGVGGPLETVGETRLARIIAVAMSTRFGVGGSAFRTVHDRSMLVDTVAFPAYTRAAIERAGQFDESLVRNQDDEYNYRLRKMGAKVLLASDVQSRYYSRGSLGSLFRQYFQYGFWKVPVMLRHPAQMKLRQFAPPIFVALLSLATLLSPFSETGRWALLALATGYVLATLVAAIASANRVGWKCAPVLPLAFAALHVAYGAGFLTGLVRFAPRHVAGRGRAVQRAWQSPAR